jgi:hypothetical protein
VSTKESPAKAQRRKEDAKKAFKLDECSTSLRAFFAPLRLCGRLLLSAYETELLLDDRKGVGKLPVNIIARFLYATLK